MAGELTTTNYGWVKPTVGSSTDAWGGYLNTDLDGIDSTVKSVSNAIPAASSVTPVMSGAGTVGTGTTFARADHQHPSDTSRATVASVPLASSTTPVMDGTAAIGVGTTWARADHVHPSDTTRAPLASPIFTGALSISGGAPLASGRLTLTTGTPVMTAAVANAATVYFTPYNGNMISLWTGAQWAWTPYSELSNVLANSSVGNAGPAAAAINQNYDLFVWLNAGVPTLTRGPPWTAGTAGSMIVRGTGAGSTVLTRVNGQLVNAIAITNGPAANTGTYVGTVTTGSSTATVNWNTGSAASGGGASVLGVWNMFNRITVQSIVTDNGATYTYSTATARAARASTTNRCTFVLGLVEDGGQCSYSQIIQTAAVAFAQGYVGIAIDATNSLGSVFGVGQTPSAAALNVTLTADVTFNTLLGLHFLQATEQGDGTNASTFQAAGQWAALQTTLRM